MLGLAGKTHQLALIADLVIEQGGVLNMNVSPFTHANKIKKPLLLIHGEADNNSGTFPIQSERLFQAIKGNGGTARLVMLPHESHGYRARESVLHTLAEMFEWANKYSEVKENKPELGLKV